MKASAAARFGAFSKQMMTLFHIGDLKRFIFKYFIEKNFPFILKVLCRCVT